MPDWFKDALPILQGISRLSGENYMDVDSEQLIPEVGWDRPFYALKNLFFALRDADFVEFTATGGDELVLIRLTEKGRREVERWPKPGTLSPAVVDELLAVLDERLADPDLPEEDRPRLERFRKAAGEVGQGVMVGLLNVWLSHVTGLQPPASGHGQ